MDNFKKITILPLVMLSLVACSSTGENSSSSSSSSGDMSSSTSESGSESTSESSGESTSESSSDESTSDSSSSDSSTSESPSSEIYGDIGKLRATQGANPLPSKGEAPILVIPVDFAGDGLMTSSVARNDRQVFFGDDVDVCPSVKEFYETSSYGELSITGSVSSVVSLPNAYTDYLQSVASSGASSVVNDIANNAVSYLLDNGNISIDDYDANGDGKIDSLFLLYARTEYDDDYSTQGAALLLDSGSIRLTEPNSYVNNLSWMKGISPYSSSKFIVETGYHMGLESYADSTGDSSGNYRMPLGYTDLMDNGLYGNNPFTKWALGHLEPTIVTPDNVDSVSSITLRPSYAYGDALVLAPSETGIYGEYLIIDYYVPSDREAYDSTGASTADPLTSEGVRVYKVDSRLVKSENGRYVSYDGEPDYGDGSTYDFAYSNNGIGDYVSYGFTNNFPLIGLLMKSANNRHFTGNTTMVTSSELWGEGDSFSDDTGIPGFYSEYRLDGDGINGPLLGLTFSVDSMDEDGVTLSLSRTEVTE